MFFSLTALADNPTSLVLDDFFYQNQKIYVVVAILVIIFLLLAGYLIRLDQKISKLEKNQNET
jgi:CcmD family protein